MAELTGESLTGAVIGALEKRLEAERLARGGRPTAGRMLEFAARFADGMAPGCNSAAHAAELYNEDGMPV